MRTSIAIDFLMHDVSAGIDATYSTDFTESISRPEQLSHIESDFKKYGTLETDYFRLDGSFELIGDIPEDEHVAYWSNILSDKNGNFTTLRPRLTIDFKNTHSSDGITLRFNERTGDYCRALKIWWYDRSGATIANEFFYPNSPMYWCRRKIEDYKKIVIQFYKTSKPYRRIKLYGIGFGGTIGFNEEEIVSASMIEEIDPVAGELSINTLDFEVYSSDFKMLDESSAFHLLQRGQKVRTTGYVDDELLNLGTFYLDKPSAEAETLIKFACVDAIGRLGEQPFRGAFYQKKAISGVLDEIFAESGIGFAIDPDLTTKEVSGLIEPCTKRDALQQVAFAIGAVVTTARSEEVKITSLKNIAINLDKTNLVDDHKIAQEKSITGVDITAHDYSTSSKTIVFSGNLPAGTHTVKWEKAAANIVSEQTGVIVAESWAYGARIMLSRQNTYVELKGNPIEALQKVISLRVESSNPSILEVTSATLVNGKNAQAVAQRLLDFNRSKITSEGGAFMDKDLKPGECVSLESQGDRRITGHIESVATDLVRGFVASIKVRGSI